MVGIAVDDNDDGGDDDGALTKISTCAGDQESMSGEASSRICVIFEAFK